MEDTLTAHTRKDSMKVKDLLEIQSTIEKRKTPCDMNGDLNQHFSVSKEEYIDILDMDLIHLVRSYSKCLGMGYDKVPDVISRSLSHIVDSVEIIKRQLDE